MLFNHDTRTSLEMTVDLVNTLPGTAGDAADTLTTLADLGAFLDRQPYSGVIHRDAAELRSIRAIRPRLREFWNISRDEAAGHINDILRHAHALPRLVRHDAFDWHIHATSDDEPLATRILIESAMALIDVVRNDDYVRMRLCGADDCEGVYVDFSKNGSKRYCDTGNCGNRMNVNAYRRRQAAESE